MGYSFTRLVKENLSDKPRSPTPGPEPQAEEVFSLLLLEKSEVYFIFRSVPTKLSIDRK